MDKEHEEFATHRSCKLHEELFKQKYHIIVNKTNYFRKFAPHKDEKIRDKLDDALQKEDVHSRQLFFTRDWFFLTTKKRRQFTHQAQYWIFASSMALKVSIEELDVSLWMRWGKYTVEADVGKTLE